MIAGLVNLSACSYIKSLFPDKEKDYQFTTEIKPLALPPGLGDNPIFKVSEAASAATAGAETAKESSGGSAARVTETPSQEADKAIAEAAAAPSGGSAGLETTQEQEAKAAEPAQPEVETQVTEQAKSESETQAVEQARSESQSKAAEQEAEGPEHSTETVSPVERPAKKQSKKSDSTPVQMVIYDDGESRLRIGAETAKAWHIVGKALSRRSIEVINRNQEELSFTVQYDPEEKTVEDGSLWDEVTFIFGGFQANDKEYLLKLIENNQQTDVAVLDQDGNPASDSGALRLLKLIQKTIQAD